MTRPGSFAAAIVLTISSSVAMAPLVAAPGIASPASQSTTRLTVAPRSTLVLIGTSNVASWRCTGTTMSGEATIDVPLAKVNEVIDRVEDGNIGVWMANPSAGRFPSPGFSLSIPIDALHCTGGKPMERDLARTMKAGRYPAVEFRLHGVRSIEHDLDAHLYRTSVAGQLALAGVTRELTVPVSAERLSRTTFRLRAELPVRMTDFAIAPPTALFGLVRANDALVVYFDLMLEAAP